MALTPQQIQSFNQASGLNVPVTPQAQATQSRADEIRAMGKPTATTTQPVTQPTTSSDPRVSHLSDIGDAFKAGVNKMEQGNAEAAPAQGDKPGILDSAGRFVEGVGKEVGGAAEAITSPLAPIYKPISNIIGDIGNRISDIPAVQKFANTPAGAMTERVASTVGDYDTAAGTIAGGVDTIEKAPEYIASIKNAASSLKDSMTPPDEPPDGGGANTPEADTPKINEKGIISNYTRAIKPTVAGKNSVGAIEKYNSNVVSAVKSIVNNKDGLSFTDETGAPETGRLPKTPAELAEALSQTKGQIFKQYDALAQKAGAKGASVKAEPIVDELNKVVSNEALGVTNPGAIKYARGLINRLTKPAVEGTEQGYKEFNAQTAQDIVKNYNSSLEAFYRNPSYETATQAGIDAAVAQKFREGLDDAISSATGEDYQALKNTYGALSSIEKDVAKRVITLNRQNLIGANSGLGKYMDIFAGGDMVQGLLTLNPALFAKGVAQSGISHVVQYLNSPDRAIQNMFESATPK